MVQTDEKVYGVSEARLASIFDVGTFVELSAYTKRQDSQSDFEGVVCGYGSVNGKLAFAFVQDSGRTKGAFSERHAKKIVDMYFARDEEAITETEKKYGRYLVTIAYNILKNHEDSEECVNDTYLKTWLTVPPTRPNSLKAYLSKLTRSRSIKRYEELNRQKRVPRDAVYPFEELEGIISDGDCDESLSKTIGKIISGYLDGVSDRRLYVFVARYFFGYGIDRIAKRLGLSRSSVNKELAKMRAELREKLEEGGVEI